MKTLANTDERFISTRFPISSAYHPDWIAAGVSGGTNPLWLAEWLSEKMDLRPGMCVLDTDQGRHLGYGRVIARRRNVPIEEPVVSIPMHYTKATLLRKGDGPAE